MKEYDVVVIGSGPAGYTAAIRASQLGLKAACVEKWVNKEGHPALGGTCLNVGCIPSKALLDSSERYYQLRHKMQAHGITAKGVELDVPAMIARKDAIVSKLTGGISMLFKKNKIDWLQGHGRILTGKKVEITPDDGPTSKKEIVQAQHIIIAPGSAPRHLPNVKMDDQYIVDSSGALEFLDVPERLGIIGAGVIGLELGSVWKRLGAKEVVLLEAMDEFLPFVDEQVSKDALKEFTKQGLDIRLGARVTSAKASKSKVSIDYQDLDGEHKLECDKLVVAVGRKPLTANLFASDVELLLDEAGYVHVNEFCETNLPGIYAIGDVVQGPMLAHKGAEEGVMVAERIVGQQSTVNHATIPWVIYTWPEIAWVGKTEKMLKASAKEYKTGVFPLKASGRAMAMDETTGMVKVIADKESDEILAVHMFGPNASEMIAEAVVAMEFKGSAEDIARTVHAHPTLSEAFHEAALAVDGRTLNL